MKKHLLSLLSLALLAVGVVSCTDANPLPGGPTIGSITLDPAGNITFPAEGGSKTIGVTSNQGAWTVSSDQSWCAVSVSADAMSFTVTAGALEGTEAPTPAKITLETGEGDFYATKSITVKQTPLNPDAGWTLRGTTTFEDLIVVAFLSNGGTQPGYDIEFEVWEEDANPGFYKFKTPYTDYNNIWDGVYGMGSQLAVLSNDAQDLYLDATNPNQVFFAGDEEGNCPLGVEIAGLGEIGIGNDVAATLSNGTVTFPLKSMFISVTDGSALGAEPGYYYLNGYSEYSFSLPNGGGGEDPDGPDEPEGPTEGVPSITGGIIEYWDGQELADAQPGFDDVAEFPLALVMYEVSEVTTQFYVAMIPNVEVGYLDGATSEDILPQLLEQGFEPLATDDPENLAYITAYGVEWETTMVSIAIPQDADGNSGKMLVQYVSISKSTCGDINDLLDMLAAPAQGAANVQVPFAPKAQPVLNFEPVAKKQLTFNEVVPAR